MAAEALPPMYGPITYRVHYYNQNRQRLCERSREYNIAHKPARAANELSIAKKQVATVLTGLNYEELFVLHNLLYAEGRIKELKPIGVKRVVLKKDITAAKNAMTLDELKKLEADIAAMGAHLGSGLPN